jgi:hypothetical protein
MKNKVRNQAQVNGTARVAAKNGLPATRWAEKSKADFIDSDGLYSDVAIKAKESFGIDPSRYEFVARSDGEGLSLILLDPKAKAVFLWTQSGPEEKPPMEALRWINETCLDDKEASNEFNPDAIAKLIDLADRAKAVDFPAWLRLIPENPEKDQRASMAITMDLAGWMDCAKCASREGVSIDEWISALIQYESCNYADGSREALFETEPQKVK